MYGKHKICAYQDVILCPEIISWAHFILRFHIERLLAWYDQWFDRINRFDRHLESKTRQI